MLSSSARQAVSQHGPARHNYACLSARLLLVLLLLLLSSALRLLAQMKFQLKVFFSMHLLLLNFGCF